MSALRNAALRSLQLRAMLRLTRRGERLMLVFCWLREQAPYLLGVALLVAAMSSVGLIESIIN